MLVAEQAALRRVAVTVATESTPSGSSTSSPRRSLASSARTPRTSFLRPRPGQGVIVGKWSEPGVADPGRRHGGRDAEGGALSEVARTGAPARLATDDPGVPPELHERLVALGVTSLVAAPVVVSAARSGALCRLRHAGSAARAEYRGATRPVRRARRRRDRERAGPRGTRGARRRAGRAQPRRRRGRDRGAARAAFQGRFGGDRPAVRRRRSAQSCAMSRIRMPR